LLSRADAESLLVEHLPVVDRVLASLSRRYGLTPSDADEASGWVRLRLVEDDLALLRKFRGESSFATYLTVVLASLLRDYRVQQWGRWRPSAEAQRRGAVAVQLETMVYRDRRPFAEAAEALRTMGVTTDDDRTLATLLASLPERMPMRPQFVAAEATDAHAQAAPADAALLADEDDRQRETTRAIVTQAVAGLSAEDQVVVKLRFWEQMSVADIARKLRVDQKPLYRRLERTMKSLEQALRARGLDPGTLDDLPAGGP
jgi:RNA polymerase sigma factor for flagellar operon FliA